MALKRLGQAIESRRQMKIQKEFNKTMTPERELYIKSFGDSELELAKASLMKIATRKYTHRFPWELI